MSDAKATADMRLANGEITAEEHEKTIRSITDISAKTDLPSSPKNQFLKTEGGGVPLLGIGFFVAAIVLYAGIRNVISDILNGCYRKGHSLEVCREVSIDWGIIYFGYTICAGLALAGIREFMKRKK